MKRTPLRRVSKAQHQKNAEFRKNRRFVAERVGWACEAAFSDDCRGWGTEAHHIVRRSQGGDNRVDNLLWVCGRCHAAIHANPSKAMTLGLLKSGPARRDTAPANAGVLRAGPAPSAPPTDGVPDTRHRVGVDPTSLEPTGRGSFVHAWEPIPEMPFLKRCSRCGWGWKWQLDNDFACPGQKVPWQ